jgi:hypothetical protein
VFRNLFLVASFCVALLPVAAQFYTDQRSGTLLSDFRNHYCSARALQIHRDPYSAKQLRHCESLYGGKDRRTAAKSPYPPYIFAVVSPFARLPFRTAALLWLAILAASCVIGAFTLARVVQLPFQTCWTALVLPLGLAPWPNGQLMPICVAALIAAAFCAQRGRWGECAAAIGVAMVEPRIALPAAIAFFLRYEQIRIVLAFVFAFLAALSINVGGLRLNEEYVRNAYLHSTVITVPAYFAVTVLSAYLGVRLARRYFEPAFVALIPPALALATGSYVHAVELGAAIPVCLLLYSRSAARRRALIVPLILLAVPWLSSSPAALFLAPLFPTAYCAYSFANRRPLVAFAAALSTTSAAVVVFIFVAQGYAHEVFAAVPHIYGALVANGWLFSAIGDTSNNALTWLLRSPSILGLCVLAFVLWQESRAPESRAMQAA